MKQENGGYPKMAAPESLAPIPSLGSVTASAKQRKHSETTKKGGGWLGYGGHGDEARSGEIGCEVRARRCVVVVEHPVDSTEGESGIVGQDIAAEVEEAVHEAPIPRNCERTGGSPPAHCLI